MKWSHLPVVGGIYDQHPLLLEQWRYIFSKRSEHEAAKEESRRKDQEAQQRKSSTQGRSPRRPSRHR